MREQDFNIRAPMLEMAKDRDGHTNTTGYQTDPNTEADYYPSSKNKGDYVERKPVILLRQNNDENAGAKRIPPQKHDHAEEKLFVSSLQPGWHSQGNGSVDVELEARYTDTIDTDIEVQYDIYNIIRETAQPTTNDDVMSTMSPTEPELGVTTTGRQMRNGKWEMSR